MPDLAIPLLALGGLAAVALSIALRWRAARRRRAHDALRHAYAPPRFPKRRA